MNKVSGVLQVRRLINNQERSVGRAAQPFLSLIRSISFSIGCKKIAISISEIYQLQETYMLLPIIFDIVCIRTNLGGQMRSRVKGCCQQ